MDALKKLSIKELCLNPGVGIATTNDLWNINIKSIAQLKGKDPQKLFDLSNKFVGMVQEVLALCFSMRCLLCRNTCRQKRY